MNQNENLFEWNPEKVLQQEGKYGLLLLNDVIQIDNNKNLVFDSFWFKAKKKILVDGGANQIYPFRTTYGNPDAVCGDFDSIFPDVLEYYKSQENVKVISMPDQEDTDFAKSIEYFLEKLCTLDEKLDYLVAINRTGGRIDHLLRSLSTLYQNNQSKIPIFMIDLKNSLTWVLKKGEHKILSHQKSKWCSYFPMGEPCHVTTSGFKWNLTDFEIRFGGVVSSSNEFDKSFTHCFIKCEKPILFSMDISLEKN